VKHPSPLTFFEAHASELGLFAWVAFRVHLVRCDACRARFEREKADAAAATFDDRVDARLRAAGVTPATRSPMRWIAAPVAAGALVVLLLLIVRRPDRTLDDGGDTLRAKGGGTSFLVYVARDGGIDLLGPQCSPGDALQAQYRTSKKQYLVVGVDPDGHARTLVPVDGKTSTPTTPGSLQSLPNSWVLDAARGRERFVGFFSDQPIDAARAEAAAKADKPALEGAVAIVHECTKQ
jgi:hypothetical protein